MSLRGRVHRLLSKFDRRITLAEDTASRIEGAAMNMLEIATGMKSKTAFLEGAVERLEGVAERLERAMVEQGRTLNDALDASADERARRVEVGRSVMEQSSRVDSLERRVGYLEGRRGPNGTAE